MAIKFQITKINKGGESDCQELDNVLSLITFGRNENSTVQLNHSEVSSCHFIIRYIGDSYFLIDETSRFGTVLDNEMVKKGLKYSLTGRHLVVVPGFTINLKVDSFPPQIEKTSRLAQRIMGKILEQDGERIGGPTLEGVDRKFVFSFAAQGSSFILGSSLRVDFTIDSDDHIKKEHSSFIRDLNGVTVIPIAETIVNGSPLSDPWLLKDGDTLEVGKTRLLFKGFGGENTGDGKHVSKNQENIMSANAGMSLVNRLENKKGLAPTAPKTSGLIFLFDKAFLLLFLLVIAGLFFVFL